MLTSRVLFVLLVIVSALALIRNGKTQSAQIEDERMNGKVILQEPGIEVRNMTGTRWFPGGDGAVTVAIAHPQTRIEVSFDAISHRWVVWITQYNGRGQPVEVRADFDQDGRPDVRIRKDAEGHPTLGMELRLPDGTWSRIVGGTPNLVGPRVAGDTQDRAFRDGEWRLPGE